jgi:hypothetical protein
MRLFGCNDNRSTQTSPLPVAPDTGVTADPHESAFYVGVPVATFPRWMLCPQCPLWRSVKLFVFAWNRCQLFNRAFPDYPAHVKDFVYP